ncbi:YncE family protein [Bacteroides intestinalis]|uniref:YncE family protein n=1 Tax=Bacteroides intestinalis TaxID=329854 RepID=UPI0018A10B3C|nr:DUF5074 domain-containing protein [Bacteroides intestinalis]
MKKYWYKTAMLVMALGAFTACSNDDGPKIPEGPIAPVNGAYVINTGNSGANNGTIQWYDRDQKTVSADLFAAANGAGIGDAQDLCIYGSKIYITCTNSAKIEVVNRADFTRIQTLKLSNGEQSISPRYMTATGGNVYFTAYDGTVSRLDTTSLSITGKIEIGDHPEALTSANGKLYVNLSNYNSDGTGKYVAVVDIATFKKTKNLNVLLNPYDVCTTGEDGKVYFISCGDFSGNPAQTLQCIDPQTDQVTEICPASKMAMKDNKIYIIYAEYYEDAAPKSISVYDMNTKQTTQFANYSDFSNPGNIVVDPATGDIIIIDQPFSVLNDIYVYGSDGVLKKKLETGYYTTNMRFVTE